VDRRFGACSSVLEVTRISKELIMERYGDGWDGIGLASVNGKFLVLSGPF
jgi:hypothetical protein